MYTISPILWNSIIVMISILFFMSIAAILAYIYVKHRNTDNKFSPHASDDSRTGTPIGENNVIGAIISIPEKTVSIFDVNDFVVTVVKNKKYQLEADDGLATAVYHLDPSLTETNTYNLNFKSVHDNRPRRLILFRLDVQNKAASLSFLDKECRFQLDVSNGKCWSNVYNGYPNAEKGHLPLEMDRCYRLFAFVDRTD